ncbi:hypothetical protein BJ912DRAFT_1061942 [Pholiota molesta]|nr:hypothetical protein BJ912DRAFT_1061942 [Pholiota molesta]
MSTLFSVSKFLGKGRSRSKRLGSTGSLVSLPGEKDVPKNPSSKLSNVVAINPQSPSSSPSPSSTPKTAEPRADSIVEISSDTESASSYYRTPLAENLHPNLPSKPERSAGDGKDDHAEESGYTVVSPPEPKPSDEWTQLEHSGDLPKDKQTEILAVETDAATKALEETIQKQKEELEQLWDDRDRAQTRTREVEEERDRVQMHAQELDDELDRAQLRAQEAEDERDRAHKRSQDLEEERDRAQMYAREAKAEQDRAQIHAQELEAALNNSQAEIKLKSQALNTLTANAKAAESQINKLKMENDDLREALAHSEAAGANEARRLQDILALERTEHDEKTVELQEQVERTAELKEQAEKTVELQEQVRQLTTKLNAQDDRIRRLERKMNEAQEQAREADARNRDLEQQLSRHDDVIGESAAQVEEKDGHIARLESGNEYMATQLINLQNNLNATERENRMLVDQLRQQASEDQAGRGLNRPPSVARGYGGTGTGGSVTITRIDSAVRAIKLLNDEIYQTAASMTDQLEGMAMRFVATAGDAGGHHRRRALASNLKTLLGTELVTSLARGVQSTDDDSNTFFIRLQTALQGCLIASCMRIITSWYPVEWEYGRFLVALHERIRGADGPEKAFQWRKAALKSCVPSPNLTQKIVALFADEITKILHLCGWESQQSSGTTSTTSANDILARFAPKLAEVAALALRLNKYTASSVAGELECTIAEPGLAFDSDRMANEDDFHPGDRMQGAKLDVALDEQVVCTVGLGLQIAKQGGDAEQSLLKPKVVLHGALF